MRRPPRLGPDVGTLLFEAGSLTRDGKVDGAWLLDRHALLDDGGDPPRAGSLSLVRRRADAITHGRLTLPGPTASVRLVVEDARARHVRFRPRPFQAFTEAVHVARTSLLAYESGGEFLGHLRRLRTVREGAFPDATDQALTAIASIELRTALDRVDAFLATLDPFAVSASLPDRDFRSDMLAYAALDATLDPEAPLARAWRARPHLRWTGYRAWTRDPHAMRRARTPGQVDALLSDEVWAMPGCGRRTPGLALAADRALAAMSVRDAVRFGLDVADEVRVRDPAVKAAAALSHLPASWVPRGTNEWLAFARCARVVMSARRDAGPEHVARLLNAKGRWVGFEGRLRRACHGDLGHAVSDVSDMMAALSDQVVRPALLLAGAQVPCAVDLGRASRMILTSGRTVTRNLEASRSWHLRQAAVRASLPRAHGEGREPAWPAAFPDHADGDVAIRALVTASELDDEGGSGPDGTGAAGLDHCVGGYVRACLWEGTRILSVTIGGVRASTAQLAVHEGEPFVVQHRGRGNATPPPRAEAALGDYVARLGDGRLTLDARSLWPVRGFEDTGRSGYDHAVPGAWEGVLALWGPTLPRALRRVTVTDVAALVSAALSVEGAVRWLPEPMTPPSAGRPGDPTPA